MTEASDHQESSWLSYRNPTRSKNEVTLFAFAFGIMLVLGVLGALYVPHVMGHRRSGSDVTQSYMSRAGALPLALELYHLHVGAYPEQLEWLAAKPSDETAAGRWNGPYVEDRASFRDAWNQPLHYRAGRTSDGESFYVLWSVGPDGENHTGDDLLVTFP